MTTSSDGFSSGGAVSRRGLAYDRSGPRGATPVVLLHAGVCDRRMWEPQFATLGDVRDVVRLDLRGFGESMAPPTDGVIDHVADVLDLLAELEIGHAHLVGASFGAGLAASLAVVRPELVSSLLLAPPGGALLTELTGDLQEFFVAERAALGDDDLDAATEANITAWVVGPRRSTSAVDPAVVDAVRTMQRAVFELGATWPEDVEEAELDPPVTDRLAEIDCPTTVLVGEFDLDTTKAAADILSVRVRGARRVDWSGVAHLPSMERPAEFTGLLLDHLPD